MADELKPVAGNGTPNEPNGAPAIDLDAAKQTVEDAGMFVLSEDAFGRVKEKATASMAAEKAEIEAALETERAEKAELARYKQEQENIGKSEAELAKQRIEALNADRAEKETALEAAAKERDEARAALRTERVQNGIRDALIGVTPGGEKAALMWALANIGDRLTVNDKKELLWTDLTGDKYTGAKATMKVSEWWNKDEQRFLRIGNVPGPPTAGAPSSPTPKEDKFVNDPNRTFDENLQAADEWNRTHPRT